MTDISYESGNARTADTVAGYLAALAIFASLIGLAWHPLRLIAPAILIALVAAAMSDRNKKLTFAAFMICTACFFFGMTIAVVTSRALW